MADRIFERAGTTVLNEDHLDQKNTSTRKTLSLEHMAP